jgi:peptide/nickel transport system permease protein
MLPEDPIELAGAHESSLETAAEVPEPAGSLWSELWHDRAGLFGLVVIVALGLLAVFAPVFAPYDPTAQSLADRLLPPFWNTGGSVEHILGTDGLGRDVLSRLIFGARISLIVPISVALLAGGVGVTVGLVAGYRGGKWDAFVMRLVDTQISFPGLLLALTILTVVGPSTGSVIVVLALNGWMIYARTTRGIVLSARRMPYVAAAEIVGARPARVVFRHILPNLTAPLLTLTVLELAHVMLAEAALSFLGLGIQPPAMSWGLDVAIGRDFIFSAPWLIAFPGAAIAISVLGINLFASWIRVAADPQEREKRFAAGQTTAGTAT